MSKENPFKYYKTSPEIIKLAVMYYIRYPLSLRQVEDILHERGIDVCHETVRYWWNKFGSLFAKNMKKILFRKHQIGDGILMRSLQKFVSIQSSFLNHFNHQRHIENRQIFKNLRQNSVDTWQNIYV